MKFPFKGFLRRFSEKVLKKGSTWKFFYREVYGSLLKMYSIKVFFKSSLKRFVV